MDGVLADMETELLRQTGVLFGDQVMRRLQEAHEPPPLPDSGASPQTSPEPDSAAAPADVESSAASADVESAAAKSENRADEAPPATTFRLTSKQQNRLWRH